MSQSERKARIDSTQVLPVTHYPPYALLRVVEKQC